MKYFWLTLLVVGLAVAVSAEEEVADDLQELQGSRTINIPGVVKPDPAAIATDIKDAAAAFVANPSQQVLLKIGNVLAALGGIDLTTLDPFAALKPNTATTGAAAGAAGAAAGAGAAALGGTIVALSAFKTALLALAAKGLQTANFVLAIIGLALLSVYLVQSEGDITGLSRYADFDTYSEYARSARSVWESPLAQSLTDLVLDAITKYD